MFRHEAVENQSNKLHGDVFLVQPVSFKFISATLLLVVFGVLLLLILGSYSRSERVSGHLVPSKGVVRIQASQFGTLESLLVVEGDKVTRGQPLVSVVVSPETADGRTVVEKSRTAIAAQQDILHTQITQEHEQLESEIARLNSERAETASSILSLEQQTTLQEQIGLVLKKWTRPCSLGG